ncbi:MAG: UvrD-helicase domain-containing protein [Bacteriovoracaceae bacterium]|nr:UvrD-helicase domain-containing protein [Bacteriovoracaceae bacterium]
MNLEHLNEAQKQAVLQTEGPVMVLAGAGSGKTRTLVSRIQYLLNDKKVSPFQLLAVTFSNKAAKEMRERIAADSHFDLGALQITTFHAFCSRVLRMEAQYLGLSRNFTIYDGSEQKSVIKGILGKRGISQKEIHPSEVQYFIEDAKNNGHYIGAKPDPLLDEVDKDDLFYDFFVDYEGELHKSNAVDFGGLITGVLNLFDNFPEVLERYQKRFKYLLVDEYQDTNRAQFKLVKMLSDKTRNICVVGDEDQSIYSWRGADIRNILDFEKLYSDANLIKLEQNYRSSKNIIEAASHVISRNEQRKGKELWTDNERGDSIQIMECPDDKAEANFVAKEVKELVVSGVDPTDIAIFYRTNAQSRVVEDALRSSKIPYRVVAGIKFYERKEIKDMLGYLRLVVNEKDSLALSRVINTPARGIGVRTLRKIEDEAVKNNVSLWELLEEMINKPEEYKHLKLSAKVKSSLAGFVSLIQEAKVCEVEKRLPSTMYEKVLHESGYYEALSAEKTYEAQARLENLEELVSAIKQYEAEAEEATMTGFLENITLDSSVDESDEPEKEVSMMTIHGSKGLEYPFVFVTGAEESLFPSYRSIESGEEAIEEERRLFYVAMTRAMKKLYILFAQGRMLWGSIKFNGPSRFLDEIPEDYYKWEFYKTNSPFGKSTKKRVTNGVDYDDEFSQVQSYKETEIVYSQSFASTKPLAQSIYPEGTVVKHKLYGEGRVLESKGAGKEEKIVILFRDGARKKFMAKFAPIEKV